MFTLKYISILLLVIISQISFNYLRTIEIKFMIKGLIRETMIVAFFITFSLLFSTFISFKGLLEGDYIIAAFYIIFGLIGKYLGLIEYKIKFVSKIFRLKKKNCD